LSGLDPSLDYRRYHSSLLNLEFVYPQAQLKDVVSIEFEYPRERLEIHNKIIEDMTTPKRFRFQ
jgi:hypothetical protein